MPKPIPSKLASVLRQMLDDTEFLTRKEWSVVLGVTTSAISHWVNDDNLPRPLHLNMLYSILRNTEGVPRRIVNGFERVAKLPAMRVTPHAGRLGESLQEYMLVGMKQSFLDLFGRLSLSEQEEVLLAAAKHCRELANRH